MPAVYHRASGALWTVAEDAGLTAALNAAQAPSLTACVYQYYATLSPVVQQRHSYEGWLSRVYDLRARNLVPLAYRSANPTPRKRYDEHAGATRRNSAHEVTEAYAARQGKPAALPLPVATVPFFERQITKQMLMAGR